MKKLHRMPLLPKRRTPPFMRRKHGRRSTMKWLGSSLPRLRKLAPLLLILLLGACATGGRATKPEAACLAFKPVYVSRKDVLTDQTARDILANNETGARLCGWKPR